MNVLRASLAGLVNLLSISVASAQAGHMMDGGLVGFGWMIGYGGIWLPILVVIAVAGLVAWVVKQKGK